MAEKRRASKPGRGSGRGQAAGYPSAQAVKYRPHLGEFPKVTLPMGADGVRITNLNGVTYAEYHFPHDGEGWYPAHQLPTEQARSFDRHISANAESLDPPVKLMTDASIFKGDKLPWTMAGTPAPASSKRGQVVSGSATDGPLGTQWWKSHLKPEIWRRLFPAAAGSASPSEASDK
jgi:hypothetical protein